MPSTFSNLGLELQATGENANTWGDKTNVGLQRVDNAIAGYTTVQANSTTITLAFSTNSGSTTFTDENGRNKILKFTSGTAGAAITVTVPDIEKEYLVRNETGQNITFSAGGGTTVTLATGKNAHIYIDGASAVYNGLADIVTTSLDTGAITTTGITTTGDINFGDDDKAVFGAGSDLQIYHDGSNSYIQDAGTGNLIIKATQFQITNAGATQSYISSTDGGATAFYFAGNSKLATTSSGIDVTGQVLADKAYIAEATLTDGATINWDMADESVAKVTLGGNRTLAAPTNGSTGQFCSLNVIQDGTGSRTLTWNAVFEFKDDTAPTLTTTASKGDLFVFRYNGSKWLEVGRNLNISQS
jgi:hypothetical protein